MKTSYMILCCVPCLQLLEAINRMGHRLVVSPSESNSQEADTSANTCSTSTITPAPLCGRIPRDDFISSKLGSKLGQQLKDVLAICGGGMPAWCRQLVFSCKFLLPFEVRRR